MRVVRRVHHAPTVPTERAIERARRAWKGQAVLWKGALRADGVRGPLEVLDTMTRGSRGVAAPTQLTRLAAEMRDAGCSEAEVKERLHGVADLITALVFQPVGPEAA